MSYPSPSTQVVSVGLARLTSNYANKPNIRAYLSAFLAEVQILETATYAMLSALMLGGATVYGLPTTNVVFDQIGALVGLPRNGLDDADYKSLLYLQVAVNRSAGRTSDWSTFAGILLRTSGGPVEYLESGDASFYFFVGGMSLNPNLVAQVLAEAVPNGVGDSVFGYSTWPDGNDFEFCDVNNVSTTGQGGFGDAVAGVVGGLLVSGAQL